MSAACRERVAGDVVATFWSDVREHADTAAELANAVGQASDEETSSVVSARVFFSRIAPGCRAAGKVTQDLGIWGR